MQLRRWRTNLLEGKVVDMKLFNIRGLKAPCFAIAVLLFLCACGKAASSDAGSGRSVTYEERVSLALVGYNYTNRYIDSFSVNGQGGGNLYVSSSSGGGGGAVCCVWYRPGTTNNKITVRWQSGACYYRSRSQISEEVFVRLHAFYTEKEVSVSDNVPANAKYMEVHFYPDGSVQAAVTAEESMPRLLLSEDREDNSRYPRCPNDKKPSE